MTSSTVAFLRHRSENVAALLMAAMFLSFLVQIVLRYVFNWPVGWTVEVQTASWLWLVLWASALVLRDREEIRFDIVYSAVRPQTRRVFRIVFSVTLVILYAISLPAAYEFVSFMRIESSSYLDIPFNYLFSIYLIFAIATILRYGMMAVSELRYGVPPQ